MEVAGDYYDFFVFSPDRLGIVVADVSGKGLDAGMVMSMTKSTLTPLLCQNLTPGQLVSQLNSFLCQQLHQQKFVSFIYAEYTSENRTFTWGGGGHEHILIHRKNRPDPTVEVIKTGGVVLGMFDDIGAMIPEASVILDSGDRVVLYSDGALEARNPDNEMFTLQRMLKAIEESSATSTQEFIEYIRDQIKTFIASAPQYDDITLVVLEQK